MSYADDHLAPLAFALGDGQDPAKVAWQALKAGYDQLAGQRPGHHGIAVLAGAPGDWAAVAGRPVKERA